MGNDIRETEVDFNLQRKLTPQEIRQTIKYNIHDVEQTIEVFRRNIYLYESQIQLIETFGMDIELIGATQAQLTAKILECEKLEHNDEFDIEIVEQHHNQKIDAPSGTALMLADAINDELDNRMKYEYDRHSKREKRSVTPMIFQKTRRVQMTQTPKITSILSTATTMERSSRTEKKSLFRISRKAIPFLLEHTL